MMRPVLGGPGVSDERRWTHKYVFRNGKFAVLPGGGWFDTARCRDPFNSVPDVLQGGLVMGQVTGSQKWAPSFFGKTTVATLHGATSLTVAAAEAVEIVRRVGSTGSLNIVGSPAAGAPAQVGRLTYSAVNTTTGVITATATGQNETQLLNISGTPSAGTFRLIFTEPDGSNIVTGTVAYNATFATVISNLNTALDAIFGAGAVVASGATYPAITLTYTTGRQALRNVQLAFADVGALTGATGAVVTEVNPGYYGTFVAGALIGATDGTFFPKSFIPPGYGLMVNDGTNTAIGGVESFPYIPIEGIPEWDQIAPYITDTGTRRWLARMMSGDAVGVPGNSAFGGKFIFPDFYNVSQ